jgi:hypothetical protein
MIFFVLGLVTADDCTVLHGWRTQATYKTGAFCLNVSDSFFSGLQGDENSIITHRVSGNASILTSLFDDCVGTKAWGGAVNKHLGDSK